MARYLPTNRTAKRNRTRNQVYVISGLLIVGVLVAFIYGNHPFGRSPTQPSAPPIPIKGDDSRAAPPKAVDRQQDPMSQPNPLPPPEVPSETQPANVPSLPAATADPQAAELIASATEALNTKPSRIIEARDMLNEALPLPMNHQQRQYVKSQLSALADKWLFSRSVFPQDELCQDYKVRSGDRLSEIGKRLKVPYEILMQINNIKRPEAMQAGAMIKVLKGPFNARVYRSTFTMDLYLQNTFVRSFRVGLGKPDMETPTGEWIVKVGGKLVRPPWTDPQTKRMYRPNDPDYPLGSRWIGLEGTQGNAVGRTGFAIHGTHKPEEIGTAGSQGCIRMYDNEVLLAYDVLRPGFSKVHVVE